MRTAPTRTEARKAAEHIVKVLRDAGHVAYFAGGCVRDELLGLTPNDYDIATDATPDRVMHLFPRSGEVGKSFGVVLVKVGKEVVEVATFRSDGDYTDKRRPDAVHFSTPLEDAQRRDYTVNALFLEPGTEDHALGSGKVIDLVGGRADLSAKVLRAVGVPDERLAEDHLRALRAVRLACKLGFEIEPVTATAITRHASELEGVSRERVGEEVQQMMEHASRARAAALLAQLGLDAPVLMFEAAMPLKLGPQGARRLTALRQGASYPAALASWALDLGAPRDAKGIHHLVSRWRRALCLSNDDRDGLEGALTGATALAQSWPTMSVAAQKRLAARARFTDCLDVFSAEDPAAADRVYARALALAATPAGLAPPPLLTGDDLVSMGWRPGPTFKRVLDEVYDAQLEEKVRTIEEARELARNLRV